MKKHALSILMIVTTCLLVVFDLAKPNQSFSAFENRYLMRRPALSISSIINNEFSTSFETYVNDQFIFRDYWISLKATFEKLANRKENNGIYFGEDHFLFEKIVTESEQLHKNEQYLQEFIHMVKGVPLDVMIPLSSHTVYEAYMPQHAPSFDQQAWLNQVKDEWPILDVTSVLEQADEQVYYRNDHHWTLYGAYLAYTQIVQSWGLEPVAWEALDVFSVDGFLGTYYSKGKPNTYQSDVLQYIDPSIISYTTANETYSSLIDVEALDTHDKYSAFLHGNQGFASIKVNESEMPTKLLVIKDSYANSLIPFLTAHFDEIDVIDLRHFSASVQEVIHTSSYDRVLFLHSFSQFSKDSSIAKLRY